jgi:predicted DNA-binding transcriptional regulator
MISPGRVCGRLKPEKNEQEDILRGTTLRVYRFIYRQGRPVGIHDVQRGLELSSPSVAQYHIRKLLSVGLIREEQQGYVIDRLIFESMIRVRRALIPFQATYSIFFASTLVVMLTILRPPEVTSIYAFALIVNAVALASSLYEVLRALQRAY